MTTSGASGRFGSRQTCAPEAELKQPVKHGCCSTCCTKDVGSVMPGVPEEVKRRLYYDTEENAAAPELFTPTAPTPPALKSSSPGNESQDETTPGGGNSAQSIATRR